MKSIAVFVFVFFTIIVSGQVNQVWFDTVICGNSVSNNYSYANLTSGMGSGTVYYYNIYKNSTIVYSDGGSLSAGKNCKDLRFINDSCGVFVEWNFSGSTILRGTQNYGQTWVSMGFAGAPNYNGLYILNKDFAYVVTSYGTTSPFVIVSKCSVFPAMQKQLIYDPAVNADIFKTDTIIGNELCNHDSLKIYIKNGTDTVVYHINVVTVSSAPASVNEVKEKDTSFHLYPNPATNLLYITNEASFNQAEEIKIINSLGECVLKIPYQKEIDISRIPSGCYIIKIVSAATRDLYSRFIKE